MSHMCSCMVVSSISKASMHAAGSPEVHVVGAWDLLNCQMHQLKIAVISGFAWWGELCALPVGETLPASHVVICESVSRCSPPSAGPCRQCGPKSSPMLPTSPPLWTPG